MYTSSGVGYVINNAGSDRKPASTSTIRVGYTGKLTNNEVFGESDALYVNLSSPSLIECWKEAIPLFGEGGTGTILSPASQAFGSAGAEGVPGNADVIFEIELQSVLFNIDEYITVNNITPTTTTANGTKVLIEVEGDNNHPSSSSVVTIKYSGYFTDGQVFDTSGDEKVSLSLSNVIPGWQEAIPLFSRGAKGKIMIPYQAAYGANGYNSIPPRTDLIFDIELEDFN